MSMIMKITCTVTAGINVRSDPSTNGVPLGMVDNGRTVSVDGTFPTNPTALNPVTWYEIEWNGGLAWVSAGPAGSWWTVIEQSGNVSRNDANNLNVGITAAFQGNPTTSSASDAGITAGVMSGTASSGSTDDFNPDLSNDSEFSGTVNLYGSIQNYYSEIYTPNSNYQIKSARSILGMPFHFTELTDPQPKGYNYGRMYTENIILNAPVATLTAGSPKFLTGSNVSQSDRQGIAQVLAIATEETADTVTSLINDLIDGKNARYFSFLTQHTQYMDYVNTLCRLFSQYLGIGKLQYKNGKTYETYDYRNEMMELDNGSFMDQLFGSNQCINVYFNPQSALQESNSNQTDQSKLAGMVNSASDLKLRIAI